MPSNRYVKWGGIILVLVLANIVNYIYWNWGLITVKVADAPLGKVIKSIEWQGWVTIYTNLPLDTKVTMRVDHVPLAEAMETLAANVEAPRPDRQNSPAGAPPQGQGGNRTAFANGTPPQGGAPGNDSNRPRDGGPGGGRGGFGGGRGFGGGGGVQWNLAFFVAPTSAAVKEEIRSFQAGAQDDDMLVYSYPTPLQMVATDSDMPASDPRLQTWAGYKPAPPPAPAPAADGQPAAAPTQPSTPTVQTYLQAFAQGANIWIMAPSSWAPEASRPPQPNSSIISAVKSFVSSSHGSVTQAIILRAGRGGGRGRPQGGGDFNMDAMTDRVRNAINGLPDPDDRAEALAQLDQEVKFYKDIQSAPPEQRGQMMRDHMMAKIAQNGDSRMSRMSPEKRAARFARIVANRQTAQGKK